MKWRIALPIYAAVVCLGLSPVAALERETVVFTTERVVPNDSWSVFVLGDILELGGGDLPNAVEMAEVSPGIWSVSVDIPVNTQYHYEFWQRRHNSMAVSNLAHGTMFSGPLNGQTSPDNSLPRTKWGWFQTSLDQPVLHWRNNATESFQSMPLSDTGPGRGASERRCYALGFGPVGHDTEFYLTNGAGDQREPAGTDTYLTKLDAFVLQDGNVFGYVPAASVSPLRRDYDWMAPPTLFSTELNETRAYRVLLPRGYDEHTSRSYPVVYWHDGALMWDDLDTFGVDKFDIDGVISAEEMRNGRLAECIQVAMDVPGTTRCEVGDNRIRNYIPPGNTGNLGCGTLQGHADKYLNFVVNEMKPLIDATYRTMPDRDNTIVAGASYGAIVSMYFVMEHSDIFSGAGCYSISFIPNFFNLAVASPVPDARIYLDSGDDNWTNARDWRNQLVQRTTGALTLGSDVLWRYAVGAIHDYDDFGLRWPITGPFLLPANRTALDVPMLTDLDGDFDTDLTDLSIELAAFGSCSGDANYTAAVDFDSSGCVDLADVSMMLQFFGK